MLFRYNQFSAYEGWSEVRTTLGNFWFSSSGQVIIDPRLSYSPLWSIFRNFATVAHEPLPQKGEKWVKIYWEKNRICVPVGNGYINLRLPKRYKKWEHFAQNVPKIVRYAIFSGRVPVETNLPEWIIFGPGFWIFYIESSE